MELSGLKGKLSQTSSFLLASLIYFIALIFRFWIAPVEAGFPFVTFYPAMVVAFYLYGISAGVLVAVLSAISALYLFIPPFWSFAATADGYFAVSTFLISSYVIGLLVHQSQRSEARLFRIIDDAPVGMATNNKEGQFLRVNQAFCDLLGYKKEELLKLTFQDVTHPADRSLTLTAKQRLLDGTIKVYQMEKRYIRKDGQTIWGLLSSSVEKNDRDSADYFISQVEDITERKQVERLLKESEQRYHFLFDESPMSIFVLDAETLKFLMVNNTATMNYGYSDIEFRGFTLPAIRFQQDSSALQQALSNSSDGVVAFETKHVKKDGTVIDVYVRTAPFIIGDKNAHIVIVEDISERKKSEQVIWHQANFDLLTDLPNRSLFFDRLSQELSKARRSDKSVALLYLDLDGFKPVNDEHGHIAGDEVLKTVAKRWQACVREIDTVVRLGGDEFAVILGELDSSKEATAVAKKLIDSLADEIPLPNNQTCHVGASVGIGIYPENATEMDSLLIAADEAMYASKERGKNTYSFSESVPNALGNKAKWMEFNDLSLIGVALVDEQHRELIRRVNNLNDAISNKLSEADISNLLEELISFAKKHFATEYKLMSDFNYPQKSEHENQHSQFVSEIANLVVDFHQGKELLVLQKMKDWFVNHIQQTDKPLGEYLAARSIDSNQSH
jgi:diguanylate cyclase (GGDEF)-like protein/PAS domain S-box-containing protein/hemerythrin-like metal-binding protein